MTSYENIIHYYNRLNGNSISLEKLKDFRIRVEKHIESHGHGPHMIDLKGILTRTTKAIKTLINAGAEVAERVDLVPIDVKKDSGKILRVASGYEEEVQSSKFKVQSEETSKNVVAKMIAISSINTDPKRFQNRQDAFSEASANSVAMHYDRNKFDPIVVWLDPKQKKTFVLSGHSRYEGMKRRGEKSIPARYFKGTEEEAIRFAKVRAATQETLTEDLAAYKLMRDGDTDKGIKKLSKAELSRVFKGKVQKLEAYSNLNANGLLIQALSQSNTSNYPYLERNAQWIGILRSENKVISNQGEDNIFHFFYSDKSGRNLKLSKDDFFKLAKKKINQLGKDESVLFPECSSDGCKQTVDKEADPQKGEVYKRLREINEALESIRTKLTSKNPNERVSTEDEKKYLRDTAGKLQEEKDRIQRDLDLMDKSQSSLFGGKAVNGPQYDAFDIQPKKKHRGPLNPLQMAQLQDAIKAGRTPKVNLKEKLNAKQKPAPLFEEPVIDPKQASLFGKGKRKGLHGVDASTLAGVNFHSIELSDRYKKDFQKINSDSHIMIWGVPGSGKTVYLLQLAQFLAEKGKRVLYVANEEYGRSTLAEKITEFKIGHANLRFERDLNEKVIQDFDALFFDSINSMGITLKGYERITKNHPGKIYVPIVQSTKDGDFRGGKDWEHVVDIAGEIKNRQLILRKNRLDPNNSTKAEKLLIDEAVSELEKKNKIKQAVKEKIKPEPIPS